MAECLAAAAAAPSDYCFPSRLWELRVLEWAVAAAPQDARCRGGRGGRLRGWSACPLLSSPTLMRSNAALPPYPCTPPIALPPINNSARFYLGCLLYDRRRYGEAVALWEAAVGLDPAGLPSAWRCLGIARFNISGVRGRAGNRLGCVGWGGADSRDGNRSPPTR